MSQQPRRRSLLLTFAVLVGAAVGGTIGALVGDVAAAATNGGDLGDLGLGLVLVLGASLGGVVIGGATGFFSVRAILDDRPES